MVKLRFNIKFFSLLVLFSAGSLLYGQNEKIFKTISISQGLSQGMIFDIIQDESGFLWIGTKNGLNRYDGYSFKVFTNDPYNSQSLSSNTVIKVFEDSQGRIWAGTENAGVNMYDKKTGIFHRLMHDPSDPLSLSGNGIKAIEELQDGRMLIATDKAGLNIVSPSVEFSENAGNSQVIRLSLPDNSQVWGLGKDKNGRVWICSMKKQVYRLDEKNNQFIPAPNAKMYYSGYLHTDGSVLINYNLYLDDGQQIVPLFDTKKIPEGNILLKPNASLWEFFHRELSFYEVSRWEKGKNADWNETLPIDEKTRICYPYLIDKSGILWAGSVGYGLRKYHITKPVFTTRASGTSVRLLIPTRQNDLYYVDYGYTWYFMKKGEKTSRAFTEIPAVKEIDNILVASDNSFWIKSDKSGYFKYDYATKRLLSYPRINVNLKLGKKQPFLEDASGYIWLPGLDGVLSVIHPPSGKVDSITINKNGGKMLVTALFEEKPGLYWVGTENGFAKLACSPDRLSAAKITWFTNDVKNQHSLNYDLIACFLTDPAQPEKYMWIATRGGGLNKLDKKSGKFTHFTTKDGLPDNVVYGIVADDAGRIWGSTNRGIFCMTAPEDGKNDQYVFRSFTKSLGLQDDEFNTGAFARFPDGRLAFGGINGINIFSPDSVLQSGFLPNVFITSISVGNKNVVPNDKTNVLRHTIEYSNSITLTHDQDILTLEFSSLDFTAPEQNKYRYQLVGIDRDWVESGYRRSATYLHLPSGTYVFRVQGSNSQGIWSDKVVEMTIRVKPPWWLTWWAWVCYVLLTGFAIRSYLQFRVNKARLESQLHYEHEEANRIKELDAVKTQLYANITHEFRTPLTVILGMANQIKTNPSTKTDVALDMIVRNGENLLNLVNQMLDLAKLESGKMTIQLIKGDFISFLRYIVESFQSLAVSQQKQFHFLPERDELIVAFDPEKIRQIITNLLSNALKFTPPGGNVYVSLTEEVRPEKDYITLVLRVKDTGIGIPEENIPHIFDRFYQTDNSLTRTAEGTGIGLALTKELVKLMKGTITVKSPPVGATKGTEFLISLPLATVFNERIETIEFAPHKAAKEHKMAESALSSDKKQAFHMTGSGPLILLVEDNADVVAYTAGCLPQYSLAVGNDGREGFEIATNIIPDLIITDVMMPFIDGFEMCRALREDERTSHIPIIMLTAKADMSSKLEGLQTGADVYLQKPFHKEELLLHIRKLIEQRKMLREYYTKQLGLSGPDTNESPAEAEMITPHHTEHVFVTKVRDIVEANFSNYTFNVEQLCKSVFMSHSQLHRKLEALTGLSPNQFIRSVRLKKAKELLLNDSLSIAVVSMECGYNDPGYFTRVFKQETGYTPQEWRTKHTLIS